MIAQSSSFHCLSHHLSSPLTLLFLPLQLVNFNRFAVSIISYILPFNLYRWVIFISSSSFLISFPPSFLPFPSYTPSTSSSSSFYSYSDRHILQFLTINLTNSFHWFSSNFIVLYFIESYCVAISTRTMVTQNHWDHLVRTIT